MVTHQKRNKRSKNAFVKDIFREIFKTKNRFLSIFSIVAIGVGFFAGLTVSGPDMKLTAIRILTIRISAIFVWSPRWDLRMMMCRPCGR